MTLRLHVPEGAFLPERRYAASVILGEFLGLPHEVLPESRTDVALSAGDSRELTLPDIFFAMAPDLRDTETSLPAGPLPLLDASGLGACEPTVPVLFGDPPETPPGAALALSSPKAGALHLPVDVFGAAFFMLTRHEERVTPARDSHGRFPAGASLAARLGFLDRPLADEYANILGATAARLWPGLAPQKTPFRVRPTHDIDQPFAFALSGLGGALRRVGGDILRRRSPALAIESLRAWRAVRRGERPDPCDTFSWLMEESERRGLTSTFYFMGAAPSAFDPGYPTEHPLLTARIREVHRRGHEAGFHPGYRAAESREVFTAELSRLRRAAGDVPIVGGRHHFLRFSPPLSWRRMHEAGLSHDASSGFADRAGFRSGTSREHTVFDTGRREHLPLTERPLAVMECTVIDRRYMALGTGGAAHDAVLRIKERVRAVGGDFTVLWHNTRVIDPGERALYISAIS